MKTRILPLVAILLMSVIFHSKIIAQSPAYTKQIITSNSGKFESSPPYNDYVTVQAYNPQTKAVDVFNTTFTQSSQFLVISHGICYLAAQDSIVKYNLNTYQRLAAIKDSGLSQMALFNGRLIVSKQYPVTTNYVEVLDTTTLSTIAEITGISGDCGGISTSLDTLYVAVNGGYLGTLGKLAIIDPSTWTLKTEVNFGLGAVGISNIYNYKNKLCSVNKTPYGADSGSVTVYDPANRHFNTIILKQIVGAGTGIKDSLLYLGLNYGIGSFNLDKLRIQDSSLIHDPGSSFFNYIISSTIDTFENRIYANIGDYSTAGHCLVTSLHGDSITSYSTGISSDAIAVDYRNYPSGIANISAPNKEVKVFPNPVTDKLNVSISSQLDVKTISVTDITGRVLVSLPFDEIKNMNMTLECRNFSSGMYYLVTETLEGRVVNPFVKH
jgi:hypothetical protein